MADACVSHKVGTCFKDDETSPNFKIITYLALIKSFKWGGHPHLCLHVSDSVFESAIKHQRYH